MFRPARCAWLLLVAAVLISASSGVAGIDQDKGRVDAATLQFFEQWLADVAAHRAGEADAIVRRIRVWTPAERAGFDRATNLFLQGFRRSASGGTTEIDARLHDLGREQARRGVNAFVRRVVILHSDVVIVGGSVPIDLSDPPGPGDTGLALVKDGEYLGMIKGDWNWPIARTWLQQIEPDPRRDPFVAAWYHATAAYMLGQAEFGEAEPHLEVAARAFPDDPRLLIDRGCVEETLALPREQTDAADDRIAPGPPGGMNRPVPRASSMGTLSPGAQAALDRAEALFRHAIERDPSIAEAHLRLGRLLSIRLRYAEARKSLTRAIASSTDRRLLFYAHLFAARASRRLNDLPDAAAHIDAAATLFPDAPSLLWERGLLQLARADVRGAIAPLDRMRQLDVKMFDARDPWPVYYLGTGRDAATLVADLWARQ